MARCWRRAEAWMGTPPPSLRLPIQTGHSGVFAFYFKELDAAPSGGLAAPCHPPGRPPLRPRVASPAGWWPRGGGETLGAHLVPVLSSVTPHPVPARGYLRAASSGCAPRASVSPLQHPGGGDGGDARAPGSWRSRGVPVAPAWMGFLGGFLGFWGGNIPNSPPGWVPAGGAALMRGDNVTRGGDVFAKGPAAGR